jgi:hypothetical protein
MIEVEKSKMFREILGEVRRGYAGCAEGRRATCGRTCAASPRMRNETKPNRNNQLPIFDKAKYEYQLYHCLNTTQG